MKRTGTLVVCFLLTLAGCAQQSQHTKPTQLTEKIPILDRQLLFGDAQYSQATLSPDGRYLAFIKPYQEIRNIWVKETEAPFESAKPVTADKRPVPSFSWSWDSHFILYVQDQGGNENYHVYAVDPKGTPNAPANVPASLDLTPIDGIRAFILAAPKSKPNELIVGLNDRDPAYHDVYRIDLASGKRTLLIKNTQQVGSYITDLDGNIRLAVRQREDGGSEILRVETSRLQPIYTCAFGEDCQPVRFHKDGTHCYLRSNRGKDVDLTRLMLLDVNTGVASLVESDPDGKVDFGGTLFSPATDELLATFYVGDRVRIYPKDEKLKADLDFLKKQLPAREIGLHSMTRDLKLFVISAYSDVDPGSAYLYQRDAKKLKLLYRSRPNLPTQYLANMTPVRYQARDGLEIPAYLTLPKGVEAKNLPTVIFPHGGPWARDYWSYNPYAQFLANRGYAVLQPNFRGSTGYGKQFLNAGNREWGTGAMQHDITDGVQYLINKGISDPKRIGIFGGSYGGYATLAGVTFTPDLYACGIPYVAPSNLITLLESFPAYWKPFAKIFFLRVGDPEIEADRRDMLARSPLFFADRIRVPLLVVHGANDPRVKQAEADRIVAALEKKGQDVEYVVAKDEGHGFRAPLNRLALAATMERFLAKHLGGRYQQDVDEEVAAQLARITVDPASVKLPTETEKAMLAKAESAPLPEADGSLIESSSLAYKLSMQVQDRKLDMDLTRILEAIDEEGQSKLRVTSKVKLPQGQQIDVFDLDKKTLRPITYTVDGMAKLRLRYADDAVTGEMGAAGRTMKVNKKLKAPALGAGAGLELAIAGLKLEDGYQTTLRVFEHLTQKVRPMALSVTGQETTQVAAGKFKTWILKLQPLDGESGGGGTLRVLQEAPHLVVKSEYKLPAMMGGGTMNAELSSLDEGS